MHDVLIRGQVYLTPLSTIQKGEDNQLSLMQFLEVVFSTNNEFLVMSMTLTDLAVIKYGKFTPGDLIYCQNETKDTYIVVL